MKTRIIPFILIPILALTLGVSGPTQDSAPLGEAAYVEPGLWSVESETLSVIVTGTELATAANAVARIGGRVSSELWLIDAVAATIPAGHLENLAVDPNVVSIVNNKHVETAADPDPDFVSEQAWPASVDVGADQLHAAGITGKGVTVAVVDSGMHVPGKLQSTIIDITGRYVFEAAVDFVGDGQCGELGKQKPGYCYIERQLRLDRYGHGTHVMGIIGNPLNGYDTDVKMGIAPEATLVSIQVLGDDGVGTYEDVIEGIQFLVKHKDGVGLRVINLSLSAHATTPYFVDPLNRAAEAAWANGIVVVAAAGNDGPDAESITVPGNDPYVITVGALDSNRTLLDWSDDLLPGWSATGPTLDGFPKPDVLAPGASLVSFMYNHPKYPDEVALLAQQHPDYSATPHLFRMNGTSMATAVTSGVVALMLQAEPDLTPDEVKYRLMVSAKPALADDEKLLYNVLQQGMGRIWAPDAVFGDFSEDNHANWDMDINADLAHGLGWIDANGDEMVDADELDPVEMSFHYQGHVARLLSDDGQAYLYYQRED